MLQNVKFTNDVVQALSIILGALQPSSVLVLVDDNTRLHVLPHLKQAIGDATVICIPAGEQYKSLETVTKVWNEMIAAGATRQSVMVNLGGGTVTDLGGFVASTFKRGIRFINIPTTILGAVDAGVGGKTGIDFSGFKNEIGVFRNAESVIISSCFFNTLPIEEIKSGFAEMLKHGMLNSHDEFSRLIGTDLVKNDWINSLDIIENSVKTKQSIVTADPMEQGLRRALNLGHTVGHALESLSLKRGKPVTHGHAVACGLVTEAVLSHMTLKFPSEDLHLLATFVRDHYGAINITCKDYPSLLQFMHHDKKSRSGEINCTLLRQCGDFVIDNVVSDNEMQTALDIYRDLMGI
ncbi:MAG: 3-dehydroquinate synthase [Muribaculaceae bacterium]|nr:3-dehydroquinate synthase [Muribaculaceae bacterium]